MTDIEVTQLFPCESLLLRLYPNSEAKRMHQGFEEGQVAIELCYGHDTKCLKEFSLGDGYYLLK